MTSFFQFNGTLSPRNTNLLSLSEYMNIHGCVTEDEAKTSWDLRKRGFEVSAHALTYWAVVLMCVIEVQIHFLHHLQYLYPQYYDYKKKLKKENERSISYHSVQLISIFS